MNDGNCDNGAFCDGSETCDALLDCQAGAPPAIDDGVACTDDSCDEGTDTIVNAVNDGNCDNGAFCDGSETCDALLDCQAGAPPAIDDGVACTDDSCDEGTDTIVNAVNDGNCDNGAFCDGAETCDALLDCQAGTPPAIDDGVACTDDSCDEGTDTIVNAVNDGNCDNGLFCDGAETCDPLLDCQAGTDPCGGGACDEGTDTCPGSTDTVTITKAEYRSKNSKLTVWATSDGAPGAVLTLMDEVTQFVYGTMTYDSAANRYTFGQRPVQGTLSVTVTSSLGGSATSPVVQK